jgi:hypothetical protein
MPFWDNLTIPASRVKKSKRENTALQMFTDTIFFFGTSSIALYLKDALQCGSRFQAKKHLTWWTP